MITTGSKLFYGLGAASLVGSVLWFIQNDGGSQGSVALLALGVALVFLGSVSSKVRDSHVLSTDTASHATSGAADRPVGNSLWPLGIALAVGTTAVGIVTNPGIFKAGIALLIAFGVEWLVKSWSERASADANYNEKVRGLIHPAELPIGGSILLAVIVLAFSRIMLALSSEAGPIVFAILGALVLFLGAVLSVKRGANMRMVLSMGGIVVVLLGAIGLTLSLHGEREELTVAAAEDHLAHRPCTEEAEHADENASRSLGAKSNIAATITLKDGQLLGHQIGYAENLSEITLARSNPSTVLFKNETEGEFRMVLNYGKVVEDLGGGVTNEVALEACTSLIGKGGQQVVTVNIPKPSASSAEGFSITVPGLEGQTIKVVVP